jgi:hypothetical protein
MTSPSVLVVEDGHEYTTNLVRFLGDAFAFTRAGDGFAALQALGYGAPDAGRSSETASAPEVSTFGAIFLDMRFDRATRFLGDQAALATRFSGDATRARRFLEDNQGTYVLAAIREAGCTIPVVFSYDFDGEPRRFRNLVKRYGPLRYLNDAAGPSDMRAALDAACAGR